MLGDSNLCMSYEFIFANMTFIFFCDEIWFIQLWSSLRLHYKDFVDILSHTMEMKRLPLTSIFKFQSSQLEANYVLHEICFYAYSKHVNVFFNSLPFNYWISNNYFTKNSFKSKLKIKRRFRHILGIVGEASKI